MSSVQRQTVGTANTYETQGSEGATLETTSTKKQRRNQSTEGGPISKFKTSNHSLQMNEFIPTSQSSESIQCAKRSFENTRASAGAAKLSHRGSEAAQSTSQQASVNAQMQQLQLQKIEQLQ